MKYIGLFLFVLGVISSVFAVEVTFNCDMNYQIQMGNFDAETDIVDVPGSFNVWGEETIDLLADEDEDGIYSVTISDFVIEETIQFKFRINQDWNYIEMPNPEISDCVDDGYGSCNRIYTVLEENNILYFWFSDEFLITQNVEVTFQVDMSMVMEVIDVSVAGTFNSWTAEEIMLTDQDGDNIYIGNYIMLEGSNPIQDYKFINGTIWEDEIENRSFVIDDSSPTQILDVDYFNDQNPEDFTSQDVTVTFQVDMNVIATEENVYVAGTFNDWNMSNIEMFDENEDGIFIVEYPIPAGFIYQQEYKFINGEIWELGFGNRNFLIDDGSSTQVVATVNFNNFIYDNLTTQDVSVNFNINMNVMDSTWYNNGIFMRGNAFPLTSTPYDTPLIESETGNYSIILLFPQGSYKDVSYTFLRMDNNNVLWYEFPEQDWRYFTIDDSNTQQNLDIVNWENLPDLAIDDWNIVPNSILILQNYPNPFNPATIISFSLPSLNPKNAKIVIYNMTGQNVMQYSIFGNQSSIIWNAENQSSGIYFYKLFIDNEIIATQKMILLK